MSISFLIELLRNGGNSAKQQILMLIFKGFLFTASYTMWVAPQFFAYWKVPWRYIMLVSFMSIAFVVVQVIFSKVFVAAESWILAVSGWFSKDYSSKLSLIWRKKRKRGEDGNTKSWIFQEQKELLRWNKKHFS